jgi:hypothetical protein
MRRQPNVLVVQDGGFPPLLEDVADEGASATEDEVDLGPLDDDTTGPEVHALHVDHDAEAAR